MPDSNVTIAPGPDQLGEGDDLLRRPEKVPNLRGAAALGFDVSRPLTAQGLWGVWVVDRDAGFNLDGLPFTLWQGVNAVRATAAARWVLAASHPVEEDATVVNFQGRLQRLNKAVPPLGESQPDWAWFGGVLRALGGEFPYADPAAVFAAAFPGRPFQLPADGVQLEGAP